MANSQSFSSNTFSVITNGLAYAYSQASANQVTSVEQAFTADDGEIIQATIIIHNAERAEIVLSFSGEFAFFQDTEIGFAASALDNALNVLPQQISMFDIMDVA